MLQIKKIIALALLCSIISNINAQVISISAGTNLFISSGTTFHADGLTLIPSANFTLSGANSITKNTTLSSPPGPTYTSRVYLFNSTAANYSGTIQINYSDAELNSLAENTLQVNNYNGSTWANYSSATNDATNNYVLSSTQSNITLKELSLAAASAPLPVTWLDFTATKSKNAVEINWSTAQENNCNYFEVLHSLNSADWVSLHQCASEGNSNTIRRYSYWHKTPSQGVNYYKIKQTDFDNSSDFTSVKAVNFSGVSDKLSVLGNPVSDNILVLQVSQETEVGLYSLDGKLIWHKSFIRGTYSVNVETLTGGIYILKTKDQSLRLNIL